MIGAYDGARAVEGVVRSEPTRPRPPAWLAEVWAAESSATEAHPIEYPVVREDRNAELGAEGALAAGKQQMRWTPEQGDLETRAAAAFFEKYPSEAAKTITWFQSIWNAFETFDQYPLQAIMYASASPVTTPESSNLGDPAEHDTKPTSGHQASAEHDPERKPKSRLWEAYARAVTEKLDPQLID